METNLIVLYLTYKNNGQSPNLLKNMQSIFYSTLITVATSNYSSLYLLGVIYVPSFLINLS